MRAASGCRISRYATRGAQFARAVSDACVALFTAQPSRSYAAPVKSALATAPRALDFASPFSPAARAEPADEARQLTQLCTRLKRRVDDVERTAAKCARR